MKNCFAALLFLLFLFAPGVQARTKAAKAKRKPAPELLVTPSPEIDVRVEEQVRQAELLLSDLKQVPDLLANSYLVSAIYYRDGFLHAFDSGRADAHPSRRIVSRLVRSITPEIRQRYVAELSRLYARDVALSAEMLVQPVESELAKGRKRKTHLNAIDLFTAEGTPVRSCSRGVIVLADGNWNPVNPFSASSPHGGNAVIVFDPIASRFYRYCHLDNVHVTPGMLVEAGQTLGTVGHTGFNAARPGHGRHLHFEVNAFDRGSVRAWERAELVSFLRDASPLLP